MTWTERLALWRYSFKKNCTDKNENSDIVTMEKEKPNHLMVTVRINYNTNISFPLEYSYSMSTWFHFEN